MCCASCSAAREAWPRAAHANVDADAAQGGPLLPVREGAETTLFRIPFEMDNHGERDAFARVLALGWQPVRVVRVRCGEAAG